MAAASGGLCLVVAVFSGPALVFLAVLTLGVCGIFYSIRQRGALEYLPSGVVDLLTQTTLLEFLTDTSVFDAIKTYLVFMMGLSEDETQRVLGSLPEDMQHTLTRPGLMHTLPWPLQDLLLPSGQTLSRQRRRRRAGTDGLTSGGGSGVGGARAACRRTVEAAAAERYDEDDESEAPLGQLVWNPLPAEPAPGSPAARGVEETDRARPAGGDVYLSEESRSSSGVDSEDDSGEIEENGAAVGWDRGRRVDRIGGAIGSTAGNDTRRRHPWREASPPHASRSLSPTNGRTRTRGRAATDLGAVDAEGERSSRRVSSAVPGPSRKQGAAGWFGRVNLSTAGGGLPGTARAAANDFVPSAERLVASILQRRVDSAVKAAWNVVDERGVRRAAVGSAVALVAHMALSERARRQAGSMLRGGLLAALAGTATVCAGLVYLKPGQGVRGPSAGDASNVGTDPDLTTETEEEEEISVDEMSTEISGRRGRGQRLSRTRRCRDRLQQWLTTPRTRSLIRLLGMICVLLAVRKWQLLRRAALRAAMPRGLYGSTPP